MSERGTWVKLDNKSPEDMRRRVVGSKAFVLDVAGTAYSNRHLLDGRITVDQLPDVWRPIGERFRHAEAAERLVAENLWHRPGATCQSDMCPAHPSVANKLEPVDGPHFIIHDYFENQHLKAEVLQGREKTATRVRRCRQLAMQTALGSAVTATVTEPVTEGVGNAPPVPVPVPVPVPNTYVRTSADFEAVCRRAGLDGDPLLEWQAARYLSGAVPIEADWFYERAKEAKASGRSRGWVISCIQRHIAGTPKPGSEHEAQDRKEGRKERRLQRNAERRGHREFPESERHGAQPETVAAAVASVLGKCEGA